VQVQFVIFELRVVYCIRNEISKNEENVFFTENSTKADFDRVMVQKQASACVRFSHVSKCTEKSPKFH